MPTNSNILYYIMEDEYKSNRHYVGVLAQRLKEYRLAMRMSQKEMAEVSGVSYATISHFEQGVHPNITLSNFVALLRAVGMERRLEELLPELPVSPLALREINKYIPKRVRRK